MFGIDSPELMVIAIVALIVIGPKELPNMLRSWGKWMAQMRGMASEFRGHVDEMVRQSELDDVKKQLVDLQSLDPTKEIKSIVQEGMAEGEKAMAEAKSAFDNPLAEPESAPQIAAEPAAEAPSAVDEPAPETAPVTAPVAAAEAAPTSAEAAAPASAEVAPPGAPPVEPPHPAHEEKPAKAFSPSLTPS